MNKKALDELQQSVGETFRLVALSYPYLVSLIQKIEVHFDNRIDTIGIFATGRLLINPKFIKPLALRDLFFVLTHEIFHLTLRTHQRAEGSDELEFSFAHDYIINDLLRIELQLQHVPAGGLDWPGASNFSPEALIQIQNQHRNANAVQSWNNDPVSTQRQQMLLSHLSQIASRQSGSRQSGNAQAANRQSGHGGRANNAGKNTPAPPEEKHCTLNAETERSLFPGLTEEMQAAKSDSITESAKNALELQSLMEAMIGPERGTDPSEHKQMVDVVQSRYQPPWELGMQRWLQSMAPTERTYARPSRRGADRTDLVLPGRKRESWTLHIILDTSGSMARDVPGALGAIARFCEAVSIDEIHLIQCDASVHSDETLSPSELARWQVTGYGGSDLNPAMNKLAEKLEVEAVIILTDGDIAYPEKAPPYQVLWVLPSRKPVQSFQPSYGKVISINYSQGV